MRAYLNKNVFDATIERLTRIYTEEENVVVFSSGGKDSTVILELAIIVAKTLNKLPVKVAFLDQESEYQATIDYMRKLKNRPEIELYWFQIPFILTNSTTLTKENEWLKCWDEGEKDKWMRAKEPDAITENNFGTVRFKELCERLGDYIFGKDSNHVAIIGVRGAESLNRYVLMHKEQASYKDILWASKGYRAGVFRLYPIYDWEDSDVWHAIAKYKWSYNHLYDKMFQLGIPAHQMRVSSIIHETGIHGLKYLKEAEPKTFERLSLRIGGVNTYNMMYKKDAYSVKKLPVAFGSWVEYRDYLIDKLIAPENKKLFINAFKKHTTEEEARNDIKAVLVNDVCLTKVQNARISKILTDRLKDGKRYGKKNSRN